MTTGTIDLTQYADKKVNIKLHDEDETFPAMVESATAVALIFRRKGKSAVEMKTAEEVETIELQPEAERELKARRLDPVTLDNVKRHLVDRHGYSLASINALSSEAAYNFHESEVDHSELGHYHAEAPAKQDKELSERDAAIAAASGE